MKRQEGNLWEQKEAALHRDKMERIKVKLLEKLQEQMEAAVVHINRIATTGKESKEVRGEQDHMSSQ